MPTYKFINCRYWTAYEDYWEEFNTDDQEKWESALDKASYFSSKTKLEKFPKKAPSDHAIWFELYTLINEDDLDNSDERTSKDINRGYFLYDEEGNLIEEIEP